MKQTEATFPVLSAASRDEIRFHRFGTCPFAARYSGCTAFAFVAPRSDRAYPHTRGTSRRPADTAGRCRPPVKPVPYRDV
jgi:hypothetical protein